MLWVIDELLIVIRVLSLSVAGPALERERPTVPVAALSCNVPDGPHSQNSSHPTGAQTGGENKILY